MFDKKEWRKEYYIKNKEKISEQAKLYYIEHKEEIKKCTNKWKENNVEKTKEWRKEYKRKIKEYNQQYMRGYYLENKEQINKRKKEYNKTIMGKTVNKKHSHKRRQLGFVPLNKYFKGSEAHHINKNDVIYIPKEIHRSVWHNIWTWQGMEQINKLAIEFI